jgi:hypothetical protein
MAEADIEDIDISDPHAVKAKLGSRAYQGYQAIRTKYATGTDTFILPGQVECMVSPAYDTWLEIRKTSREPFTEKNISDVLASLAALYHMPDGWAERMARNLKSVTPSRQ